MAEASPKERIKLAAGNDAEQPADDLETLRRIIVGPEKTRIHHLEKRLDESGTRADELSRVLPDAIVRCTAKDQKIARSLQPTIEESIRVSVQKNPEVLADAIFPLMGPGIRKAIASTIMGMIQSFNQLLNHSFSIQGLKWRVEALRTRRPYAEILLLNTLLYQVEQVFLIHRKNGLVLQHVVGPSVKFQDPDLVSGMLTAIEDFVRDSFNVGSDQSLDTLRIGSERSIWIEQGPKAIIAVVIRGTPPLELRDRMADILGDIHLTFNQALDEYDGDAVAFEAAREELRSCLGTEFKASEKKTSPLLWVISIVLLVALALWAFTSLRLYRRTEAFLAALRAQPGIVLTGTERRGSRLLIFGLKDPLVDDPTGLLSSQYIRADRVDYRWRPYVSLEPELIMMRAHSMLQPPSTVTLSLDKDVLVASGEAGHPWIRHFYELGTATAGISRTRADNLIDTDMQALQEIRQRIEGVRILFPLGASAITSDQEPLLIHLSGDIHALGMLSKQLDRALGIRIVGFTDASSSETANLKLSQGRAEAVRRFLIDNGKVNIAIMAVGMGSTSVADDGTDEHLRAGSRFAGFELVNDGGFMQGKGR
ncbi:OmpA family protein [Desulfosarcina sp.]|uniref:OmpA family protein n=1 Tax=Desulfosarcina sp. TaxID=2027861 RepID=UPI0029A5920B|nr:OmpA family protein [Desulfosarcina sp.]MDX2452275.1 OmpA family protein [Desulfosarcina sp.]MDX2490055.1 OmpA family protein [Desulfosarcina sp.]